MLTQGRKYFRFSLLLVAAFCFNFGPVSPSPEISFPKGCTEAAQNYAMTQTIDLKLVSNIVSCLRDLYKLYKSADWRAIQSLIPNEVKDVIRKAPKLWKNSVDIAKQSPGMCLVSVYLASRAVDIYDQTMRLQMDNTLYKKEFEWLEMELNSVLDLIHNQILPASEYFSTGGTEKITEEILAKLDSFHSDIKQLIREIHKDIIKAQSEKIRASVTGLSSLPALVTFLLYGNIPGAILSGTAAATSLHSHMALTNVIGELESLQNEGQERLNEIHEYRFLLQEKLTAAKYSLMSHLLVFIFVTVLFLWSWRINRQNRGEFAHERNE
ncbi:PREDICTED: uncharacterized protein LOC107341514 [Acropora digitifera]|uniref:uncharacterized protein LOC107341514 n=1 Tax=Acropora digitifera TaxID=70779 RepID=UPI00077A0D2D|nr:PREDICTED: uncharacterized protein LOC107341514 [Acropora digitifera]